MITINISKYFDLFKIVCISFILGYSGNFFFEWPIYIGLFFGLILGIWESLYEMIGDRILIPEESLEMTAKEESSEE